ncbi:MAG: exopolysaccharide biosynthesis protein [Verrucomicrobiota bacterium]
MTTEKPKKAPLKTAPSKSKTGSPKLAPKSLKAGTKKAKSTEKDWQEPALPEKSPLKKVPAKKSVSKVNLNAPKAAPKEDAETAKSEAQRTSAVLKSLLENNSDEWFTVEQICVGLGTSSFGVSLLAFSIPEVVPIPVPGISAIVALPTAVVSGQMMAGKKELRLPKWLLKRKVPRKALAAAIHAVLPALKRIEKGAKPRGRWVSNPLTQRLLGLFIFVLALFIALPIPATNMPPAIAIFVTSLGMVERDGVLICVGVLIGLASMVLIGAIAFGSFSLARGLFGF